MKIYCNRIRARIQVNVWFVLQWPQNKILRNKICIEKVYKEQKLAKFTSIKRCVFVCKLQNFGKQCGVLVFPFKLIKTIMVAYAQNVQTNFKYALSMKHTQL